MLLVVTRYCTKDTAATADIRAPEELWTALTNAVMNMTYAIGGR